MPTEAEREVILLSVQVAGISVAVSLIPGVLIGWALARWRSPARVLVQGLLSLPLVMPPVVTGWLLLMALGRRSTLGSVLEDWFGLRIAYTTTACVIAASVVGFPLLVESVRLAVLGVDPRLAGVSRTLGRGRAATFLRVTLPLSLPGILGGGVLCFARALGEFGATIVLAGNIEGETRTIPLAVFTALNAPGGEDAAARLVGVSVALSLAALLAAAGLSAWQRRRAGSTG